MHAFKDQAALQETTIPLEAHIAMLTERLEFLTTREAEARRLLIAVHEQLAARDDDYRTLLGNYEQQLAARDDDYRTLLGNYEQQHRDLIHTQDERARLSSELNAVALERIEMARRIAELEIHWHEKNIYIETLETAVRVSPFTSPILFALRAIRRLQRLIK